MKYSRLDWYLVCLSVAQVLLLILPFLIPLPVLVTVFLVMVNIYLGGMNYQCVAHNFIHNPFFKSKQLNGFFSVLNSIAIGLPQSSYRLHHLNHHRFNNQPENDESSTWKYGKNGKEESIFTYSFIGLLRTDVITLIRQAGTKSNLVYGELIVLMLFISVLALLNSKLVILYLIPSLVGGQIFALWENYCEHHRADPYDRLRDSVSCYAPFYNWIWFNNGYHQEHHLRPQVHWTMIRVVQDELPKDRVIVTKHHLTNSF